MNLLPLLIISFLSKNSQNATDISFHAAVFRRGPVGALSAFNFFSYNKGCKTKSDMFMKCNKSQNICENIRK